MEQFLAWKNSVEHAADIVFHPNDTSRWFGEVVLKTDDDIIESAWKHADEYMTQTFPTGKLGVAVTRTASGYDDRWGEGHASEWTEIVQSEEAWDDKRHEVAQTEADRLYNLREYIKSERENHTGKRIQVFACEYLTGNCSSSEFCSLLLRIAPERYVSVSELESIKHLGFLNDFIVLAKTTEEWLKQETGKTEVKINLLLLAKLWLYPQSADKQKKKLLKTCF